MTSRRAPLYALASSTFVVVGVVAFLALPERPDGIRPAPFILVALVLAPVNTLCNAAEYAVTARYGGIRVGMSDAVAIAIFSTAANLLPVPGSAIVRAVALRRAGVPTARAAKVVVAAGVAWLACTALAAGVVIGASGGRLLGVMLSAGAVAAIAATHCLVGVRGTPGSARLTAALVGVEAVAVCVGAFRMWASLRGLGYRAGADQSVLLTAASVVATATGLVPGGLGLREALAAWIAPLASLPRAVGAASSVTDRLLGLPVLIGALVVFWGRGRRRSHPARRALEAPSPSSS